MPKVFKFCLAISLVVSLKLTWAAEASYDILTPDIKLAMQNSIFNPLRPHLIFNTSKQANQWLELMSKRLERWVPNKEIRLRYLTIIQYEAIRAELDPQLVLSLITIESKFNQYAVSSQGAMGLMQVMPFWQRAIGNPDQNLFDVNTNIRYGCSILAYYIWQQHGNLIKALARYNGSSLTNSDNHYSSLVLNAYNKYWYY